MIAVNPYQGAETEHYTEKPFAIKLSPKLTIYGLHAKSNKPKGKRAVICSHGLTGKPHEHLFMASRNYFTAKGYDVIRFAYYASPANARKLEDCTLEIHASDLNEVVQKFRGDYEQLFVVGHSYGGLTTLIADPEIDAVSFWDSSYVPEAVFTGSSAEYIPAINGYLWGWGTNSFIGKDMVEEAKTLDRSKSSKYAAKFKTPSQVVLALASEGENPKRKALFEDLECKKELVELVGTNHTFTVGDTVNDLLDNALKWFERF